MRGCDSELIYMAGREPGLQHDGGLIGKGIKMGKRKGKGRGMRVSIMRRILGGTANVMR